LLAQKSFNNPIDQIFSYDYRVTDPGSTPSSNACTASARDVALWTGGMAK